METKNIKISTVINDTTNDISSSYFREIMCDTWDWGECDLQIFQDILELDMSVCIYDEINKQCLGFMMIDYNKDDNKYYAIFLYVDESIRKTSKVSNLIKKCCELLPKYENLYVYKSDLSYQYKSLLLDSEDDDYYLVNLEKILNDKT